MMNFLFSFGSKRNKSSKRKSTSSNHTTASTSSIQKPLYLSQPYVNHMLVRGNFKKIVELPKYVDLNEWLAFNVFEFFNHINVFYGSLSYFCTSQTCPTMSAGPGVEYTWSDSTSKKIRLSAPEYIDYMTTHLENTLNEESIFPTKSGPDFPRDFVLTIKKMFSQMFKLFAHIYHCHYETVLCLTEEPHFNSLFAHFMSFAREFDLLDKKEIQPLGELIDVMLKNGVIC